MKCLEYQEQLQRRLDGEPIPEGADVERHIAQCGPCREMQVAARRLEAGLRHQTFPAPSPDLTDRIVAVVVADRWSQLRFRRRLVAVTALAASLLVAVASYTWFQQHSAPAVTPAVPAPVVRAPEVPGPARPPAESLNDRVEEAGSAVVALTRRTAGDTVGQTRMLWPEKVSAPTLSGTSPLPRELMAGRPAQSLDEARQGVSSGLEPVTTSARRAMNLFLNELPPVEPEPKRGM